MTDLLILNRNELIARSPVSHRGHVYGELSYRHAWIDRSTGDLCWLYQPTDVLVVDGITYRSTDDCCERPIIWLYDDQHCSGARMRYDMPPTDAELDEWVRSADGEDGLE